MKKLLTLLMFVFIANTQAQTQVSGNQSGTWTQANSPYQVIGDITIPAGQVLTIEAGVEVNFQGHYSIDVNGQIIANGTEQNMIVFTATNHSTGWNGVIIDGVGSISQFHYCHFEYGIKNGGSLSNMHGGAFFIKDADAQFFNCTFTDNEALGSNTDGMGGAVYAFNTGSATQTLTKFIDCKFERNHAATEGGAIKFTNDARSEITRCTFINNRGDYGGGAIMFYVGDQTTINNCLFYMNSANNSGGGAIKSLQTESNLHFTHCTFAYNSAYGNANGGACDFNYANVTLVNSIIYGNSQQYGKEINVGMGASVQIDYCDVDMPSDATGSNNLNNVNPLFVNIGQQDFHLQSTSPCIDAGLDIGHTFNGSAPDLGCYEYGAASIKTLKEIGISIYPNPATDFINISHKNNIDSVLITDLQGKAVKKVKISFIKQRVNISELKTGIYLMQLYKQKRLLGTTKIYLK